jgi:hypothetical protein
MSEARVFAVPALELPRPADDKFRREQQAFYRLLGELLKTHRGRYVAIHNETVVGSGPDAVEVALHAYRSYGYQPIYVDLVEDHPLPPIRIPHYRITPRLRS